MVKASLTSDDAQTLSQAVLAAQALGVSVDANKVLSQLKVRSMCQEAIA